MRHVLLGKIVGRYELGMEGQSHRSWEAGSRLGHDKGFKSIFPHLRSYCYGAEQRLYPHCSSWMYPHHLHQPCCPFRDQSKPLFMLSTIFNLGLVISWIQKSKSQISHWSKRLRCQVPTNRRGFAPRLLCMGLQGCTFCNSIMLLEKYTLKTRVSWYGMVFQCIVTIFLSDSCLAGCPKLTFWIQCEKLYLLWMYQNIKVVCSTICRGHVKAFRHSFLVDHSPQPSPAHQVNGPCGVKGQASPGSNWNGKPIHYARGAKPFSLMVFSSKAYTREAVPILSMFSLQFLFSVIITRPE